MRWLPRACTSWAATSIALGLVAWPAAAAESTRLTVSPPPTPRVGARAEVGVSVEPPAGARLHESGPLFIDLDAPEALGLERTRLGRDRALRPDAPTATFRVGVRPNAPGTYEIRARARGWACRGGRCRAFDVRQTARVTVAPATAADPPPRG